MVEVVALWDYYPEDKMALFLSTVTTDEAFNVFEIFNRSEYGDDHIDFGTSTLKSFPSMESKGVKKAIDSAFEDICYQVIKYEEPRILYRAHRELSKNNHPLLWEGDYEVGKDVLEYITDSLYDPSFLTRDYA